MREFTNKLLELVESGLLDANEVLRNIVANYMSEDDVRDFCQTEYETMFSEEE